MADFADDGFVEAVAVEEAVPAAAGAPAMDDFVAAAAPLDNGNGAAEADEGLFSSGAVPADDPPAPVLQAGDPRIAWAASNAAALAAREASEAEKRVSTLAAAKEYLDKVYKVREVQLSQRKKSNREAEAVAGVAEGAVPKGSTPWERVISVCNFNSEALSKDPFKEMSRYKAVLLAAKAANISVGA
ncbi:hypothetical protein HT031_004019 [Scenedesmus sp. PABB004]|nr:hypothetical protein HT031_004019 [Scenedesmus sp. PABB004]